MDTGAGQTDDLVAGLRLGAIDELVAFHEANTESGQVEGIGRHDARMLGCLAADEGAADRIACLRDAGHQRRNASRIDAANGDIVKEEIRLGAVTYDIVRTHGDQVLANGVEPAQPPGDLGLRPHAVRGRDKHGLAIAGGNREGAPETTDSAEEVRVGHSYLSAQQLHGMLARLDVDSGATVCLAQRQPTTCSSSRSSRNLRLPTS